ncbi:hypothetical protein [Paenibacillus germinis]|uniref:hypothetical protein n=1 Tax=Paenibacillus germinis TaxID=2654979 RepID=UPI0014916837|nr:hypothetical protein [Paenibacillus germinis]
MKVTIFPSNCPTRDKAPYRLSDKALKDITDIPKLFTRGDCNDILNNMIDD